MSSPSSDTQDSSSRMHAIVRSTWIIITVIVGIVVLGVGIVQVTASPKVCSSCHEMQPAVETWATSSHTQVGCPACHEEPLPWYRFPQTLAVRGVMFQRDISVHVTSGEEGTATISAETSVTIPDSRCLECHDPSTEISMRFGTLIDHTAHLRLNDSCVSCHAWTAHPEPDADKALLFMGACFDCHGQTDVPEASGECGVCHPPEFEQRPVSHEPSGWQNEHGELAKPDQQQCAMCHEESFCLDCHGLEMPHPTGWEDGASSHGPVAAENRQVCTNCHPRDPDFCSMCHHDGFQPKEGPWIDQHPELVVERGASFCLECHDPLYCYDCHTIERVEAGSGKHR